MPERCPEWVNEAQEALRLKLARLNREVNRKTIIVCALFVQVSCEPCTVLRVWPRPPGQKQPTDQMVALWVPAKKGMPHTPS